MGQSPFIHLVRPAWAIAKWWKSAVGQG